MADNPVTTYEDIPYDSTPWYPTHPDCQAALATLFGLQSPPADRCHVLELGCANGGNLIPMALTTPNGRFVGIDLSPRQVADGQEKINALGLTNVELKALSIMDVDESFGQFDYVICHGVYSWVPTAVQEHILHVCSKNLAPNGVACVSYNTYPGWHLRGVMREFLGFHVRPYKEPRERLQQAKALLALVGQLQPGADDNYGKILKKEADLLAKQQDAYLFHEHLEDENEPIYFNEFCKRLRRHGLQYLAEAWLDTADANLPPEVSRSLAEGCTDRLQLEQYLDFFSNRTFRVSLVCHGQHVLRPMPRLDLEANWHVSGGARPVAGQPLDAAGQESFCTFDGTKMATNNPWVKAILLTLIEAWPRALPLTVLARQVLARLSPAGADGDETRNGELLSAALLDCYRAHVIALHQHVPQVVAEISARPIASPFARLQARRSHLVTNLWHRLAKLDDLSRLLLPHLDGRHDHAALVNVLCEQVQKGALTMQAGGQPVAAAQVRESLARALTPVLQNIAGHGLLVG